MKLTNQSLNPQDPYCFDLCFISLTLAEYGLVYLFLDPLQVDCAINYSVQSVTRSLISAMILDVCFSLWTTSTYANLSIRTRTIFSKGDP